MAATHIIKVVQSTRPQVVHIGRPPVVQTARPHMVHIARPSLVQYSPTADSGTTQVVYTQTPDMYGNTISQRRGSVSKFYHYDALGSTSELTDSSQNVTDTNRYHAFGSTLSSTGSTTNAYGYVGKLAYYSEPDLGLQYLRARWYDPSLGRFMSEDPLGIDGGDADLYAYVKDNPANATDPSGLGSCRLGVRCRPRCSRWNNSPTCKRYDCVAYPPGMFPTNSAIICDGGPCTPSWPWTPCSSGGGSTSPTTPGGGGAGPGSTVSQLSHKTVTGPFADKCGGYDWTVKWLLSASSKDGCEFRTLLNTHFSLI